MAIGQALAGQFGRYRIVQPLGQGGMGAVYLAHDTQLDRRVALKVPHFRLSDDAQVYDRFYREARVAATFDHPNLCPVFDVGQIDGVHYLTMPYVEGRPLAAYVKADQPMAPRAAASVVRKVALALAEAHRKGVVHRDLKPSNVIINRRKEPVVMDFGLARRASPGETRLTQEGAVLGTPAYMAPEQVAGDPAAVGPACDVYSLGVILYELLTGRLPYEGPSMAVLVQIATQDPPPATRHRPDLDPRLDAICRKAMARPAADRYGSMADFAAALTLYLQATGTGPASAPASTVRPGLLTERLPTANPADQFAGLTVTPVLSAARARRAGGRRRLVAGVAAAVLALLAGAAAYLATGRGTVRIDLSEPDAPVAIRVDGSPVAGVAPDGTFPLRPGEHRLEVAGNGFEPLAESFTVRRGGVTLLHVQLRRQTAVAAAAPPPADRPAPAPPRPVPKVEGWAPPKEPAQDPAPRADTPGPPAPAPPAAPPVAHLPRAPSGSPLRFVGFSIAGSAAAVPKVAPYTNVVVDKSWRTDGDAVVNAARAASRTVILPFTGDEVQDEEQPIAAFLTRHRDVIAAVCWGFPYENKYKPVDVANVGRRLKERFPGVGYWVAYTDKPGGRYETRPVPPEVDVIMVVEIGDDSPARVRAKADDVLPGWRAKANGRPVVLCWTCWDPKPPGLARRCLPGTLRACFEAARRHRLAGVVFDPYDTRTDTPVDGIAANPRLVAEVREAARQLGFPGAAAVSRPVPGGKAGPAGP